MKVLELIEELQQMPAETEVRVFDRASTGEHEIETISSDFGRAFIEINTLGGHDA